MLVLSRKVQQQVRIGDDITISIVKIKGNSISIGIDAPSEVHVMRAELLPFEQSQALPGGEVSRETGELVETLHEAKSRPAPR